jgi:hypothetical protein
VAKIDGGVVEAEAAGGSQRKQPHGPSPRKKPHSEETFLICLDRTKATAKHGRTEPIELEGDPDDRADGGRPKKGLPKMTKAPPVTQEDDGVDDLDKDEVKKEAKAHGVPSRGRQIDKEAGAHDVRGSGVESDEDSAPFEWVVAANHKAMRALADNRSFRGTSASRTSASRMAADTRAAEAAPPAWAQTTRPGYRTFRETPQIRTQTSPTEHRNGCTWWS